MGTDIYPHFIAISPTKNEAYVTCNDDTVKIINTETNTLTGTPIPVTNPLRIVVTPDGSEIFITRRGTPGYVFYYNFDTYASDDITVGLIDDEYGIAITPDGRTVYAVCADSTIWPINVESHEALIHIDCPERVWVIAITPDGTTGYVTTFSGDHTYALNLSSNEFSDPIALGSSSLYDIAITPDQAPTALFTSVINGLTVTFDASTSTSPVGDVVEWNWDFGDGDHETSTTRSPKLAHT